MTNPKTPSNQTPANQARPDPSPSNRGFQSFDPQKRFSSSDGSSGGNFADDPEPVGSANPERDKALPSDKAWTKAGAKSPDDFPEGENASAERGAPKAR